MRFLKLLLFLPCLASAADTPIPVELKTLQIGEGFTFVFEGDAVTAGFSSSDPVVAVEITEGKARIVASDFGEATVTVFSENGQARVFRVTVETPGRNIPPPFLSQSSEALNGFRAELGTQVGFRSDQGWFDNLVRQEEFISVFAPAGHADHEFYVESLKPIQLPAPKSERYLEKIRYRYKNQNGFSLSLGDTDLFWQQSAGGGPVRGVRVDQRWGAHQPFVVAGIQTLGARDLLTGSQPSTVGGVGYRFSTGSTVAEFRLLGFRENPALQLLEEGMEAELGLGWHRDWIRNLELRLTSDKRGKIAWEATTALQWQPWTLTLSGGRTPSNMAVLTLPNRFGASFDSYGASLTYEPESLPISVGATTSRTNSFLRQDQSEGTAVSNNSGFVITVKPSENSSYSAYGNVFESLFTPFASGTANRENGWRADFQSEMKLWDRDWLTLNLNASQVTSTLLNVNYENQQGTIGWKRYASNRMNFIHGDVGVTRFGFPSDPLSDGYFLLGRVGGATSWNWGGAEGRLQYEKRVSGGRGNDTIRAQLGIAARPIRGHELRLAIFRDFEWLRSLYRQTRGFYLRYVIRFGAYPDRGNLASTLFRSVVSGRVYEEGTQGEIGSEVKRGLEGVRVGLDTGKDIQWTQTNSEGLYVFEGLPAGDYTVRLETGSVKSAFRLVSVSQHRFSLPGENHFDFVYSERAEIHVMTFNDMNYDGVFQEGEPPVSVGKVRWELQSTESTEKTKGESRWQGGSHRMTGIPAGEISLSMDPFSLPSGFLPEDPRVVSLEPRQVKEVYFPLVAQRSLSGRVYRDKNGNGIGDSNEGLSGVEVRWGKQRTRTGKNGSYLMKKLLPGSHRVECHGGSSQQVTIGEDPVQLLHIDIRVP